MSAKDEKEIWDNQAKRSAGVLRKLLEDYPLPEGDSVRTDAEDALREHTALNQAEAAEKGAQARSELTNLDH